jgi:hypothetical protein
VQYADPSTRARLFPAVDPATALALLGKFRPGGGGLMAKKEDKLRRKMVDHLIEVLKQEVAEMA